MSLTKRKFFMKLVTTTADLDKYSGELSEIVRFYEGTGFRSLDLNLYTCIFAGSPFLDDRWKKWTDDGGNAASELNIDFSQAHAPTGNLHGSGEEFDVFLGATIRSIEACARLGIPNIIVHPQDIGGYPSREYRHLNLQRNRDFFEKLFPTMEKTGVYVLIENSCDRHAPTQGENIRHFSSTAAEMLDLADYINHPLLQICWDTGHANVQGVDQYKSIMELGNRLRGVHIADNYGDMDSHVAPFQGTTNIDAVMQGLLDSGYQGNFTFEASNILRTGYAWPNFRREWQYHGEKVTRLMNVPLSLKRESIKLLHEIGKHILTEYGCFDEE